jgi:hypothetical protein
MRKSKSFGRRERGRILGKKEDAVAEEEHAA